MGRAPGTSTRWQFKLGMTKMDPDKGTQRLVPMVNNPSNPQARQQDQVAGPAKFALENATEQLSKSLAAARATLDSTTVGILATDQNLRVTAFNRRFLDMMGVNAAQVEHLGQGEVEALVSAQLADPSTFLYRLDEIQRLGLAETKDLLKFTDGRVLERASQIQYIDGVASGRVWTYHDITERHQSELALQEEKRALAVLNETGAKLASSLDLQAVLQAVTDAATSISGARFGAFFLQRRQ
jgi:PAS domain S-box-containing protein